MLSCFTILKRLRQRIFIYLFKSGRPQRGDTGRVVKTRGLPISSYLDVYPRDKIVLNKKIKYMKEYKQNYKKKIKEK